MKSNKKLLAVLSVPAITSLLAVAIATPVKAANRDFHDISTTPETVYANADYTSSNDKLNSLIAAVSDHPTKFLYELNGNEYNYQALYDNYIIAHKTTASVVDSFNTAISATTPVPIVTVTKVDAVADVAVSNGTPADKLGLPTTVGVTLSDGTKDAANVTWDTTKFDGTKAGDQTITGTLTAPAGKTWSLTDAQKTVSVKVTVKQALAVSSVSAVTSKTAVQVTLADGQDDAVAANKASYEVKVGDTEIPVTAVAYVKDANKATLTVDLSGQDGIVTVNGVAAKAAVDFKAPEVTKVTPANLTTVYVDYSEKVSDTAINAGNYGVVVKGTATTGTVTAAERVSDTRVRLTLNALKAATTYTLTTANVTDANGNILATASNDFTAVDDTTKPVVTGVTQVDGAINATLTIKFGEEVNGNVVVKLQKYDTDGNLGTAVTKTVSVTKKDSADVTLDGRLDDAAKYCVTVAGDGTDQAVADLAGNKLDEQKLDFTAVRDTVAPSIVSTESKDGKLTITFSEKLNAGSINIIDALTGLPVAATKDTTNTDATKLVYNLTGVTTGKNYIARLTGVADLAGNVMDAQNVTFAGTQAVVKVQLASAASTAQTDPTATDANGNLYPSLSANTVVVKFNTSVTKSEAENIANYKVYETGDKTKTLAVTNAVYDDTKNAVTLTTADQVQNAGYTVEVSGLTNLDTVGTTVGFTGIDYKAPVLKSVAQTGATTLKATFDEAVDATGFKATLISTDYSDSITVTPGVADANGNLTLNLAKNLTSGKTYVLRLEGVKDVWGNYRAAGSTSAVVTSTQLQLDTAAPKLVSSAALNSKTLQLTFDEDLSNTVESAPNVVVKDSTGTILPTAVTKIDGSKVTVSLTGSDEFLTGKTYSAEVYRVTDLVGNTVQATGKITTSFAGNKDVTAPKLVSAASSVVKGSDYKVGDNTVAGIDTSKNYTKVTLTFNEVVQLNNGNNIGVTVTAPDFTKYYAIAGSAQVGEDGKTIEFLVDGTTNAGDNYIVNVATTSVEDIAATPNALDPNANYANFSGVDTKAPTLTTLSFADKDGKNEADAVVDSSADTITLTLGASTEYETGSAKLSEDVKVSLDSTNNAYDVSGISVSKSLDTSALTNLALGLYGKSGATGAQLKAALNGSTITLEDAVGNKTTYTVTVQ